ncbi:hypothetical protein AB0A69_32020 [Streptomyces sp. NPDC045431]|uniref:hypothetical protein n=1 Tax=Streptomyces sp. NPDC045431 TaxID=3155613 RepID=UPI0033EEE6C5
MTTDTGTTAPVPHHFVLTIQTDDGFTATTEGIISITPGAHTRQQVYTALCDQAREYYDLTRFAVVHFALEPNHL